MIFRLKGGVLVINRECGGWGRGLGPEGGACHAVGGSASHAVAGMPVTLGVGLGGRVSVSACDGL